MGTERESLSIPADNFEKVRLACSAFSCTPYFAIVIDAGGKKIHGYLLAMEHLLTLVPKAMSGTIYPKMAEQHVKRYAEDPMIKSFELQTTSLQWWSGRRVPAPRTA